MDKILEDHLNKELKHVIVKSDLDDEIQMDFYTTNSKKIDKIENYYDLYSRCTVYVYDVNINNSEFTDCKKKRGLLMIKGRLNFIELFGKMAELAGYDSIYGESLGYSKIFENDWTIKDIKKSINKHSKKYNHKNIKTLSI